MNRAFCCCIAAVLSACSGPERRPIVFRPVVADAVRELERVLPEPPPRPAPDGEMVSRVRARAESLASDPGPMRPMIALSVSDFGDDATPVLAQLLGEANAGTNMRLAAAEMLGLLDSPDAAEALVYHATSNPVSWIRAQCAWRLASTTQDQCVPPLLETVATERDAETRTYLASTLAHFGCPTFGANEAVPVPSKRLELAVWKRLDALRGARADGERKAAITVLGLLPTAFARQLGEALVDADPGIRTAAARALEAMGPRASVAGPALLDSLTGDPAIEVEALNALGALHHTPAAPAIEARLSDRARSLPARTAAARALGRLDVTRAVDALIAAHDTSEPASLRVAAAGALCALGRSDVGLATLVEGLRGEDSVVAASDVHAWLYGLEQTGNEAARRIRMRCAQPACPPGELADLVVEARAELVR